MPPPNMVYEAFILSQVQFSVGDTVMIKVGEGSESAGYGVVGAHGLMMARRRGRRMFRS